MSVKRHFLFLLLAASLTAGTDPFFEPDPRGGFLGRWPHANVHVDSSGIVIDGLSMRWKQPSASVHGEQKLAGISNYFFGNNPAKWRTSVPHYSRLRVSGETGIVVYGSGKNLEFDFEIPPGKDASSAVIDFPESAKLTLTKEAISVEASGRKYRLHAPVIYQTHAGRRERVAGRFILENPHRVAFSISDYDRTEPLVIDPLLEWLTYYGGNGEDQILASGTDSAGNIYLGGATTSTNLPFIGGSLESANPGTAGFITKLNPLGTEILYSTYVGGLSYASANFLDAVRQLVVDASGNVYATGNTKSAQFPTTLGAWVSSYSGSFALKLDRTGSKLVYSTFTGVPTVGLQTTALAVDSNGNAYIGGNVGGPQLIGTSGSYQPNFAGSADGIILALNPAGTGLQFATLFGGSGIDSIQSLVLDASGNIIIGGSTTSVDLPVTSGSAIGGSTAGFLAALDATGARLLWSTYLPGSSQVSAMTIVGSSVIACGLNSPKLAFPRTVTPQQPTKTTDSGFIAEFDSLSGAPQVVSFVPGYCSAMTADPQGYLYLSAQGFGAMSGGSLGAAINTISMLSPDLSQILFNSSVGPDNSFYAPSRVMGLLAGADARLSVAGYSGSLSLPTTDGVIQRAPDPAPRTIQLTAPTNNPDDGFAGRFDLSAFRQGNFLISGFQLGRYSFSVGSTAVIETIPVVVNGSLTLQASANVPWLTVAVVAGGIQVWPNANAAPVANAPIQITVSAAEIPGSQFTVTTTMTVLANPTFTVDTTPVTISVISGLQASSVSRNITYNFAQQPFSFNTVSSNPTWLFSSVQLGSTNGQAQLHINTGSMPAGTYSGTISVSITGASNTPQVVPVTYTVFPAPALTLSPSSLTMIVQPGQATTTSIGITSTAANTPVWLFLGTSTTWMTATLGADTAPCKLIVTASPPAGTAAGIYYFSGTISMGPGLAGPQFTGSIGVSGASGITAVPASISATYYGQPGQLNAIQVVAPQVTTVTLVADQPWISFSSPTIVTPNYSYVIFNYASLAEGSYTANIFVRDTTGKTLQTIPVSFSLYNPAVLTFSTAPIAFKYNLGDPSPPSQTFHISSPTLKPGYFNVGPTSFPSWLTVSPSYGSTPADIMVTANPTDLSPGVYNLNVVVSPQYSIPPTTGGGSIPVTLTVSGPIHPMISAVVNAASGLPGPVSAGELILIYGTGVGGGSVSSSQLASGSLPTTWSGTTVTFDELQAPVLYTANNVVCVAVPYGLAGRSSVAAAVSYQGNQGPTTPISIAASAPGFFTADESGSGQASAFTVNADGTYQVSNSSHPAAAGDVLVLYLTGAGVVNPSSPDGAVNSTKIGSPTGSLTATIGNLPAQILFAGTVPGLLNGVLQVNLVVPSGLPAGSAAQLGLFIGGNATQPGVTIALR